MGRIFILLSVLFLFTGCEKKIFHHQEISIGKIDSYNALVDATNGVYGKLAQAVNCSLIEGGFYPDDPSLYIANVKGDDLNVGYPNYNEFYNNTTSNICDDYNSYTLGSYTPYIYDAWKNLYRVIVSANNILNQQDRFTSWGKAAKETLGEVYLIRAYCYFRLTRTYGRIPLVHNMEINYNLTKPSFLEIYQFIEHDLKLASELLPPNNAQARIPYVTPHRGTAKAILAEVYLNWAGYPIKDVSKYSLAAKEAGEVIDSAGYFGFGLVDDFAWLWDKKHYHNKESVFTLYFADPEHATMITELNTVYRGFIKPAHPVSTGFIYNPNTILQIFNFPVEINFFNNYPSGYRKEITFFTNVYVPPNLYYVANDTGYVHITKSVCARLAYRKFFYDPYIEPISNYHDTLLDNTYPLYLGSSKVYIYRFAQTMLTYAEAAARSGQLNQKAYDCINEIRRRAHHLDLHQPSVYDLQPGLSPQAFADSVVQERAWELAGELEGRWFDLVRLEKVEDLPNLRAPDEGGPPNYPITKADYFYPPPPEDMGLDPNLNN